MGTNIEQNEMTDNNVIDLKHVFEDLETEQIFDCSEIEEAMRILAVEHKQAIIIVPDGDGIKVHRTNVTDLQLLRVLETALDDISETV